MHRRHSGRHGSAQQPLRLGEQLRLGVRLAQQHVDTGGDGLGQLRADEVVLTADVLDRIDEIVPPGTNFGWADAGYSPPAIATASERRRR